MPIADCRLPIADCRLPIADCRLPIADCRLPIADCRLPIADCRLPIADCRLPIADCRLPIADCRFYGNGVCGQVILVGLCHVFSFVLCQWLLPPTKAIIPTKTQISSFFVIFFIPPFPPLREWRECNDKMAAFILQEEFNTMFSDIIDAQVQECIAAERRRQETHIELIASENFASPAVMAAQGSVLTNKYAEGYPGRRYYGGCSFVDDAERLAIARAKQLFGVGFVNVQPHSGSQANQTVYHAFLQPGDTILGMSIAHGGHLSHGAAVNAIIMPSAMACIRTRRYKTDYDSTCRRHFGEFRVRLLTLRFRQIAD